ncbi:prolactin-6A1-like isoform X1 [Alexandromys fortis]|uniref:prolactin-6A1-like isoform X1 n=1 Tax=Alexandromys fortis TaxID=100897 RepID=UPI0021529970|nr:prolactin-6A1-like isoform X1 [Microtus fortis]
MRLSLSQPCFSGTLLIMLLLNIFLWEMVASVPVYTSVSGYDGMSLKELLDHAVTESYNIRNLTAEMHRIFMEDVRYTPGRWFPERDLTACHTSALSVLIPKNRAQQFWGEFLLKETIGLLGAWNNPLHHITTELSHMEDAPNDIISKAKVIEGKIKELLMALKSILNKVNPGFSDYIYPTWNGLASLQSPDEDTRFFALYDLLQCLKKDTHKVLSNVSLLKCQFVYGREC